MKMFEGGEEVKSDFTSNSERGVLPRDHSSCGGVSGIIGLFLWCDCARKPPILKVERRHCHYKNGHHLLFAGTWNKAKHWWPRKFWKNLEDTKCLHSHRVMLAAASDKINTHLLLSEREEDMQEERVSEREMKLIFLDIGHFVRG